MKNSKQASCCLFHITIAATMPVCSYGSNCLGLNVTLEQCRNCDSNQLHHLCQGEYESKFFPGLDLGLTKLCLPCLKVKASKNSNKTMTVEEQEDTTSQQSPPPSGTKDTPRLQHPRKFPRQRCHHQPPLETRKRKEG